MAEVEVRALGPEDVDAMEELDEQSEYYVYDDYADFVEDEDEENDYLWGIFVDGELVGFCVTADADDPDFPAAITEHPLNDGDSTFLSHVYIDSEQQGNGYGMRLVHDAIVGRWGTFGTQPVFLSISDYLEDGEDDPDELAEKLGDFFAKNGFEQIPNDDEGIFMVLDPANFRDPADEDGDDEDMDDEDNE